MTLVLTHQLSLHKTYLRIKENNADGESEDGDGLAG